MINSSKTLHTGGALQSSEGIGGRISEYFYHHRCLSVVLLRRLWTKDGT